jgi:hypothetical protein
MVPKITEIALTPKRTLWFTNLSSINLPLDKKDNLTKPGKLSIAKKAQKWNFAHNQQNELDLENCRLIMIKKTSRLSLFVSIGQNDMMRISKELFKIRNHSSKLRDIGFNWNNSWNRHNKIAKLWHSTMRLTISSRLSLKNYIKKRSLSRGIIWYIWSLRCSKNRIELKVAYLSKTKWKILGKSLRFSEAGERGITK